MRRSNPAALWSSSLWTRGTKYINLSQINEYRNWKTKHYNSVLEIRVSFVGIHKWELDIYIGFSPTLHLQFAVINTKLGSLFQALLDVWYIFVLGAMHSLPLNISLARFYGGFSFIDERLLEKAQISNARI